ncbi:phospholipase D family protein [Salinibacter ruber]|uniref:phospholipase D family protein n=1 Tax=Salinibacter ruber TaxID=146919 RepID=UPI0013AEC6DE|nr:phospholipase D family protein [Salinibacter ruber]
MQSFSILNPVDQPSGHARLLDYLREGFQSEEFSRATLMVAFSKSGPLRRLRSDMESWTQDDSREIRAIFGIDQRGTSEEALRLSLELFDQVHLLHQRRIGTTFHPKIYYFEGEESFSAYVGSNNLTTGGLETNFESGIQMELNSPEDDPLKYEFYECWEDTVDVARRLDESRLSDLVDEGLVPTEESMQPTTARTQDEGQNGEDNAVEFPEISFQPASSLPQTDSDGGQQGDELTADPDLVWRKRNLKARDSQRPGPSTNPSGVITLVRDYFKVDGEYIDKTTYFRNDAFGRLNWWEEGSKEVAADTFEVSIEGQSYGVHELRISHDPDWESNQDNYTTALHWGPLNETLRDDIDIRGLNFYLFDLGERWRIEIRDPIEEDEG